MTRTGKDSKRWITMLFYKNQSEWYSRKDILQKTSFSSPSIQETIAWLRKKRLIVKKSGRAVSELFGASSLMKRSSHDDMIKEAFKIRFAE